MENTMATPIRISILTFLVCSILALSTNAQERQGKYMHIDYLKIENSSEDDFLNHISSTFLSIQELRKENGSIEDWYVYKVTYPGTRNSFYNYIVITISDHISAFEDVLEQYSNGLPRDDRQSMTDDYMEILSPNHSELWKVRNSVIADSAFSPSRYIVMNYMDVGLGYEYEYQMFEDEIALPIHEERMQRNQMEGWELQELLMPGGLNYGYNFSTVDYYDNLENIEFGFTEELIRHTHPDTDINEFFDHIYRTRDLIKFELWELVEAL